MNRHALQQSSAAATDQWEWARAAAPAAISRYNALCVVRSSQSEKMIAPSESARLLFLM